MPKFTLIAAIVLCVMVSAEILPSNVVIQPLTITANINVLPVPQLRLPTFTSTLSADNPCGFRSYCGQAANFKSQADLKAFTDKNCPPILYYPLLKTPEEQTASASQDFSGTNNQEGNVDEADILKTDGEYIYTVSGNILSIIRAYPINTTKVMSTLSFTSTPASLFLEGNYLAIMGTDYEQSNNNLFPEPLGIATQSKMPIFYFSKPYTWVYVYDVSKKANPKLVKDFKVAGYYFDGRKADNTGFVYILSQLNCNSMDGLTPWFNFGQGKKNMTLQQVFYYPGSDYNSANFINIFAFNLRNPLGCQENVISVLTLNTYLLYMSENYIYLTSTEWMADAQSTKIHKIYVSKSKIIPMADGSVSGYVNNQFSLDEYNGTLRIATSETGITGIPSNSVFCLDTYLNIIGTLRNIAKNETIFSARYADTRLYLVTFRRIDPFFVIDLSNHKFPKILGELKITGFSNYLHPYDKNTVIGFGQQTNAQGQQTGLKVSLFDVSNVSNPQSVADFVLPQLYVYSTAQWQHKAFLFSKEKNLMVVPASYYDWQDGVTTANSFNGAMVFYIKRDTTGSTIQLRAIVNHVLNTKDQFWDRYVERSLYIQDMLYTKSRCLLRAHTLSQLTPVVNLDLNCNYDPLIEPRSVSKPVFNPAAPAQIAGLVPIV